MDTLAILIIMPRRNDRDRRPSPRREGIASSPPDNNYDSYPPTLPKGGRRRSLVRLLSHESTAEVTRAIRFPKGWDPEPNPRLIALNGTSLGVTLLRSPQYLDATDLKEDLMHRPGFDSSRAQRHMTVPVVSVKTALSNDGTTAVAQLIIEDRKWQRSLVREGEKTTIHREKITPLLDELVAIDALTNLAEIGRTDRRIETSRKAQARGYNPRFAVVLGVASMATIDILPPPDAIVPDDGLLPSGVTLEALTVYMQPRNPRPFIQ
jgi:hypothetical protein